MVGNFFLVSVRVHFDRDLPELLPILGFFLYNFGGFSVLFVAYFDLSSDIKRVNIGSLCCWGMEKGVHLLKMVDLNLKGQCHEKSVQTETVGS